MAHVRPVVILLAHGFCEGTIITCLEHMREAGLAVTVVGLTAGLILGKHGLAVQPDLSLNQLQSQLQRQPSPSLPPKLIVLPDGRRSANVLSSDPRLYRLIEATYNQGGYVATMTADSNLLGEIDRRYRHHNPHPRLLRQGDQHPDAFIQYLIQLADDEQAPEPVTTPNKHLNTWPVIV